MSVKIIEDESLWDKFVDESPHGLLFHKYRFLKIAEKYHSGKLRLYGIYKNSDLVGIIPLFVKRINGIKLVYSPPQSSISYIPYMGFVTTPGYNSFNQCEKEEYWEYIVGEIDKEIGKISPNFVSLALIRGQVDARPFTRNKYELDVQYTYVIDLDRPIEEIWDSIEKVCKKKITSSKKYDLSIKQVNDVDTFYGIMRQGLEKQGNTFFHIQSPAYLKELMEAFPENIKLYFLYSFDEVIGVDVNYFYKDLCMSWMGTTAFHETSANEYLLWELIKIAKDGGYGSYEITGADERRLNPFKNKFNPSLKPSFFIFKKDAMYTIAKYSLKKLSSMIKM